MSHSTEPAFPQPSGWDPDGKWVANSGEAPGMTLRDYFAANATEDDINAHMWKGHKEEVVIDTAYGGKEVVMREAVRTREEAKYHYADAMLQERAK